MTDIVSKAKRSWNMSRIRGKDTGPEKTVRTALHKAGYRFRLHSRLLPGKPDIVLAKYRTVIFVHGCFWHQHKGCKFAYMPKSRVEFWRTKFKDNINRDVITQKAIRELGWKIIVIWECEISDIHRIMKKLHAKLGLSKR